MKKFIAVFLSITLILSSVSSIFAAFNFENLNLQEIPPTYNALVEEDFESCTPSINGSETLPLWLSYSAEPSVASPEYLDIVKEGDNTYLSVKKDAGDLRYEYKAATAHGQGIASSVYWKFRIKLSEANSDSSNAVTVQLRSYNSSGNLQNIAYMPIKVGTQYDGTNKTVEAGEWYDVEFLADTTTSTYKVWIDGYLARGRENTAFTLPEGTTFDWFEINPERGTKEFYIDDYVIYEDATAALNTAANALTFDTIKGSNASADAVTSNLSLPTSLDGGLTVEWTSNNTDVVSNTGVVTASTQEDKAVTLTAKIKKGTAYVEKTIDITVSKKVEGSQEPEEPTLQVIPPTYNALVDDDFEDSTPTASNFIPSWATLNSTTAGSDMALIENGDNNYLQMVGGVGNRTHYTMGTAYDKGVSKLYWRTKIYLASDDATFVVNIKSYKSDGTYTTAGNHPNLNKDDEYGTGKKVVANKWYNFETVVDTTTGKYVMYIDGELVKGRENSDFGSDGTVDRLEFFASAGTVYLDDFVVYEDATAALNTAANALTFDTIKGSNASADAVTGNLSLPTSLDGGLTVEWTSNNPDVVSNTGVVTASTQEDKAVTLTAKIKKGTAYVEKTIDITVSKKVEEPQEPEEPTLQEIPPTYNALVDDDFEDSTPTASNFIPSWAELNSPAYDADMALIENGDNNYLELTGVVGNRTNYTMGAAYGAGASKLYWRTKIYLASDTATFTVNIRSYKASGDANLGNSGNISLSKANTYGANNTNIVTNKWYTFETVVDTEAGTYSMYIDGKPITGRNNVAFDTTGTVDGIQFFAAKDKGSVYVDDFVIYEDAEEELTVAANALTFDTIKGENTDRGAVTTNLVLPTSLDGGLTVEWTSENPDVVSNTGVVMRALEDIGVDLTAKIKKGTAYLEKTIRVGVLRSTVEEVLNAFAGTLKAEDYTDEDVNEITTNLKPLPTSGPNNIVVSWASNNAAISISDGNATVTRPEPNEDNVTVTLTATITMTGQSESTTKTLEYTVLRKPTPAEIIDAEKSNLTIDMLTDEELTDDMISGAVPAEIKTNLKEFPSAIGEISISWHSGDTSVMSDTGVITRGNDDASVTLTATFSYQGETDTKTFDFTVLPVAAKLIERDIEATIDNEAIMSITKNFTLPTVGSRYGTTFTWASSDDAASITGADVTVTRPEYESGDKNLAFTLTAVLESETVTKNIGAKVLCKPYQEPFPTPDNTGTYHLVTAENFNKYEAGVKVPDKWGYPSDKPSFVYSTQPRPDDRTNMAYELNRITIDSAKNPPYYKFDSEIKENMHFSFWLYDVDYTATFSFNLRSAGAGEGQTLIDFRFTAGKAGNVANAYNKAEWFKVDIEASYEDATFSVWVDDTQVVFDQAMSNVNLLSGGFGRICLEIPTNSAAGKWYVDDFGAYIIHSEVMYAAYNNLTFDEISTEAENSVTQNLTLPTTFGGCDVEWISTNPVAIETNGTVNRANYEQKTTLTAIFRIGTASLRKSFDITVPKFENTKTTEQILNEFADSYFKSETYTSEDVTAITQNLIKLDTVYPDGITVSYSSNKTSYIANDGTVTRPEHDTSDEIVTITATASKDGVSASRSFSYTVLKKPDPYAIMQRVADTITYEDLSEEEFSDDVLAGNEAAPLRQNLEEFITTDDSGVTISWGSSNTDVLSNTGVITRGNTEQNVTLTATFSYDGYSITKEFPFIVMPSAISMIEQDIAATVVTTGWDNLTEDIAAPAAVGSIYGTEFTWDSSSTSIVFYDGIMKISRPAYILGDETVTVTLTAKIEDEVKIVSYEATVISLPTDQVILDEEFAKLTLSALTSEDENNLFDDINLPTELDNGVVVEWSSSNNSVIDAATGHVNNPDLNSSSETVTLTATVRKNSLSATKTFTFTVRPFASDLERVEKAKNKLQFSLLTDEAINEITENLSLMNDFHYGTQITWQSNADYLVISGNEAIVTQPEYGKAQETVTLTAVISYNQTVVEKVFNITVLEKGYQSVKTHLFDEDFESWADSGDVHAPVGYWNLSNTSEVLPLIATAPNGNRGNSLFADRSGEGLTGAGYFVYSNVIKMTGDGTVRMSLYFPSENKGTNTNWYINLMSKTSGNQAEIVFDHLDSRVRFKTYTNTSVTLVNTDYEFPYDEWIDLRFELDIKEKRYHLYVDKDDTTIHLTENGSLYKEIGSTLTLEETPDGVNYLTYASEAVDPTIVGFRCATSVGATYYMDDLSFDDSDVYTKEQIEFADEWERQFLAKNDIENINKDLVIPTIQSDGITVLRESGNLDVLSSAGVYNESGITEEPEIVKYYVTFDDSKSQYLRHYTLKVYKQGSVAMTDSDAVRKDVEEIVKNIEDNYLLTSLAENLTLPATGTNNSAIVYTSSNPSALTNAGVITQGSTSTSLTLTITANKGSASYSKVLNIIVAAKLGTDTGTPDSGDVGTGEVPSFGGPGGGAPVVVEPDNEEQEPQQPQEPQEPQGIFNDIKVSHWAYPAIKYLADKGILNGVGDGSIQPERPVTREELVKMVVVAIGKELEEPNTSFTDVDADGWSAPYIATAHKYNLVTGFPDGSFGGARNISRQDLALIIYRASNLKASEVVDEFKDNSAISDYAAEAVYALRKCGVINGDTNGRFNPTQSATRAETAKMLYEAIMAGIFE